MNRWLLYRFPFLNPSRAQRILETARYSGIDVLTIVYTFLLNIADFCQTVTEMPAMPVQA
jgi:hypothetical protein